jgi:hypothetical protein
MDLFSNAHEQRIRSEAPLTCPGFTHPSYFLVNTFGLMRLFFMHSGWTEYLHLHPEIVQQ